MTTAATLTPRLVRDFRRDGFVVVPDLLSAGELRHFGAAVDEGVARRSRHDARQLAEKSLYEQSFIQCQNLWEDCPDVRPLTFHPAIAETAARLLGVAAVRLWHDQALYKEGGGRQTDPHQDHPYWPIVETDTITAWIPFDGSTFETGAMGYLPGSHRLGLREFVDIFSGHGDDPLTRAELEAIDARVRGGAGRVGRLPPRPHLPLGQAQPDRYRPSRAHRHLLRRRVHPRRGLLPAPRGGTGRDRHGCRHRQRRHAAGLAPPRRCAARSACGPHGLMTVSVLTAAQRTSWTERGFFRVGGFADPATCTAMLERVIAVVRDPALAQELGVKVLPESNKAGVAVAHPEDGVSKVFKLHRDPVFARFAHSPGVVDVVAELVTPDIDVFLSQFIFKTPGAWGQPWHQDSFYFPFEPARPVVGVWLAVTEATLVNGCLHVLPGSQTEPVHTHIPDRRPGANYGYFEIVDHDMGAAEPVLMDPGDLLVFDSHLMHCSTDNESDGIRAAMVYHYAAAGTVDHSEEYFPSTNDWVPVRRDGRPTSPLAA